MLFWLAKADFFKNKSEVQLRTNQRKTDAYLYTIYDFKGTTRTVESEPPE